MNLHRVVEGPAEAPALILSNSLGTTREMWEPQVGALTERYRVVRYDRRGHGQSPVAPGPTTIDDLGGDLVELLDDLGLARVSFCGLSLGGVVGMWLAVRVPERVDRLTLCCCAAVFAPRQGWLDRAAAVRADGVGSSADAVLGRWFNPSFDASHADVVARFRAMLLSTPAEGYAACCDALADVDLTDRLGSIEAATLVLTGSDDPVVPSASGAALAAAIPGARHVSLDGAAHIANVEQAESFTQALLDHLADERG